MSNSIPEQMKALRLEKFKENYKLRHDVSVPTPGAGEILVRIAASGFCHTDYMVYEGAFETKLPHTGSHEPTGVIAALGPDTTGGWKVGDRVGIYLFKDACGTCSGCKWYRATFDQKPLARYCEKQTMQGIIGANGGFAEYMITDDDALMKIPDKVSFEQAAPMMCAGATVWNGIIEANLKKGETVAIVGIGSLGLLAIQFAKALGYRVAALTHRDIQQQLEEAVPKKMWPDITVSSRDDKAVKQILDFTDGIGLHAAVVCTDDIPDNDWILHRLQPRGTSVVLGLPSDDFRFKAMNLVFREIVVKGALHASVEEMSKMLKVAAEHGIVSEVTTVSLDEAENLPERSVKRDFKGKMVVRVSDDK